MNITYGKIKVSEKMNAIVAFVKENDRSFPLGFVSYADTIGIVYVTDQVRRRGVASKLLELCDKDQGKTMLDDGSVSVEGSRLLKALGRPRAKFYGRPDKRIMSGECARIMLGCIGLHEDSFDIKYVQTV